MANGEHAYQKLLTFVKENLEYFEHETHKRVEDWGVKECEKVIFDAFMTMENVAMYDDCDEMIQIEGEELVAAFRLIYENYMHIDCQYYLFEKCASIQAIVGLSVAYDIRAEKPEVWVGNVVHDGWAFPVYRMDDTYAIDLGGSVGMTDFIQFATQNEAFEAFEKAVMGEE